MFKRNQEGAVALIVAIVFPIVLLILALTIDMGKVQTEHLDNGRAVDSSAFSAAEFVQKARLNNKNPTNQQITDYALKDWQANSLADQSAATLDVNTFTATLANDVVTVNSCVTLKSSGFTANTSGDQKVCSVAYADVLCIENSEEQDVPCPGGQTGNIHQKRSSQCPSGVWGPWLPVSNTCVSTCIPSTETRSVTCPNGQNGSSTETRQLPCPLGSAPTPWTQTSTTCVNNCTQTTQNETRQCSVELGNTNATGSSNYTRTSVCPSGTMGGWLQTSSNCCVPETQENVVACTGNQTGTGQRQKRDKACPSNSWGNWYNVGANNCAATCNPTPQTRIIPCSYANNEVGTGQVQTRNYTCNNGVTNWSNTWVNSGANNCRTCPAGSVNHKATAWIENTLNECNISGGTGNACGATNPRSLARCLGRIESNGCWFGYIGCGH